MRTAARVEPARLVAGLAFALLLAAAGCASKPKRVEPPPPEVVAPPVHAPPASRPPSRPAPPPEAVPPPPRNFAEEKAQRKIELAAADERNAVGAGEVGYYLDVLQGRLKQQLGTDTGVARRGELIVIVLPPTASFPVGETALPPGLRSKLAPLSQVLIEYRRVLVGVYVHADASVLGASNPRLAQQRARVIAAYLGGAGVDPRRVLLAPATPLRPSGPGAASNGGRSRIEIQLEPVLRPNARAH